MMHTSMLVLVDSVAMLGAFEIARFVRAQTNKPFAQVISGWRFAELMVATIPLWIFIFAMCGLYRFRTDGGRVGEAGRIIAAVVGGVMLFISIDYLTPDLHMFPSRSVPLLALAIGVVLVVAGRQLVRRAMRSLFQRGRGLHNVILIGTGDVARRIAGQLNDPRQGYRLVAAVSGADDGGRVLAGVPVYSSMQQALAAHPDHRIDEIVQADLDMPRSEAVRQMAYANSHGIGYRFVPDSYGVYAAASRMGTISGVPVMEVRLTSLDGWGAVGKRIFDIVGAVLLLVVLTPLLLALAVAVKLSEPDAPVLYTQQRLGLNGRPIGVKKFRTMGWQYSTGPGRLYATTEAALTAMGRSDMIPEFMVNHKLIDDPRVSRLGAFLRKTSLDELPQLLNALRGELSLVGPRPITQGELDRYGELSMSLLALTPGITGLWQVHGRSSTTYEERVKLDIYYVENWSVGMDMSILARTLVSVAARKGAV